MMSTGLLETRREGK